MTTIALILGALGSLAGIASFVETRLLKRRIASGAKCKFCGISSNHPDAQRFGCARNPDGGGHTYEIHV